MMAARYGEECHAYVDSIRSAAERSDSSSRHVMKRTAEKRAARRCDEEARVRGAHALDGRGARHCQYAPRY